MLLDQTRLPHEEVWLDLADYRDIIEAIKELRIRGAPAIGVAGAYALALAAREMQGHPDEEFSHRLEEAAREVQAARPTGANLAWSVRRMMDVARRSRSPAETVEELASEASLIQEEDERANRDIGRFGAELVPSESAVLTHCNTGALATGGYGTALGVILTAWAEGKIRKVFATETRPVLQGARLTAWELARNNVDATMVADSAAGYIMSRGEVQTVMVGADRIAANGDVANKIGTYALAVLAKENGVSFYVAAPTGTIDLELPSGDRIPVEERSQDELTHLGGVRITAPGVGALNPAFDITPHRYVSAIVTEMGVLREPYDQSLAAAVEKANG